MIQLSSTRDFSTDHISLVLWTAQICLTLFPAWFLFSLFRQAKRSGYRERSALLFAAALFTWTIAGIINAVSAYYGVMPYYDGPQRPTPPDVIRILLSTINTLFLTIGATRLDNFPTGIVGNFFRRFPNWGWGIVGLVVLALVVFFTQSEGGLESGRSVDIWFGLFGAIVIAAGLINTFYRYEMGILTAGIVTTLALLEFMLFFIRNWPGNTDMNALFLTSVLVTSKAAFMMILIMLVAAWGRYYTSGAVEELKKGVVYQKVRVLIELKPRRSTEYDRRNAYQTILLYWPNAPALLEAIKTKRSSSKEVLTASSDPQMVVELIEAGILNLSLSNVGDDVTTDLMRASTRAEEELSERR